MSNERSSPNRAGPSPRSADHQSAAPSFSPASLDSVQQTAGLFSYYQGTVGNRATLQMLKRSKDQAQPAQRRSAPIQRQEAPIQKQDDDPQAALDAESEALVASLLAKSPGAASDASEAGASSGGGASSEAGGAGGKANPTVSGLLELKQALSGFAFGSPQSPEEESTAAKAVKYGTAAIDAGNAATGAVDGIAKLDGNEKGVGESEVASKYTGTISDAIGAIKSAFEAVKTVYQLYKKNSEQGVEQEEAFRAGISAVTSGLESAKSAVSTVKTILELLDSGTGNLATVIPGLGIAISGIKITVKVYDMLQSNIALDKMTNIKRTFKDKYTDKPDASPSERRGIVKENNYSVLGKTIRKSKGTDKAKLEARKQWLTDKFDRTAQDNEELGDIQDYQMAKQLKEINVKRQKRAGMQLGLEMMSMAGDIATLSGAGSAAGVALKTVASVGKVGMVGVRTLKQKGRDKAASSGGAWAKVFDAEKSTGKKNEKRTKDADLILDMIAKLPDDASSEGAMKQFVRVEQFIAAAGTTITELLKKKNDYFAVQALLSGAMAKRE